MIETTVSGLGYEVVDVEFASSGLLRVYIENPYVDGGSTEPPMIAVGDCQKVSNQLSHVLLVEDYDYDRLEVSSPGLDRPLKTAAHFRRFVGEMVTIRLREQFQGRRNFQGLLMDEGEDRFGLELFEPAPAAPTAAGKGRKGKRASANKSVPATTPTGEKLVFEVNEVDRARLVPQFEFRRH